MVGYKAKPNGSITVLDELKVRYQTVGINGDVDTIIHGQLIRISFMEKDKQYIISFLLTPKRKPIIIKTLNELNRLVKEGF